MFEHFPESFKFNEVKSRIPKYTKSMHYKLLASNIIIASERMCKWNIERLKLLDVIPHSINAEVKTNVNVVVDTIDTIYDIYEDDNDIDTFVVIDYE